MNTNPQTESKDTILLVDRSKNLKLLSYSLLNIDYIVWRVISGRMARKTVKIKPPDVVILDVKMP